MQLRGDDDEQRRKLRARGQHLNMHRLANIWGRSLESGNAQTPFDMISSFQSKFDTFRDKLNTDPLAITTLGLDNETADNFICAPSNFYSTVDLLAGKALDEFDPIFYLIGGNGKLAEFPDHNRVFLFSGLGHKSSFSIHNNARERQCDQRDRLGTATDRDEWEVLSLS